LKPWANRSVAPSFRFGATASRYSGGCAMSGTSIATKSADFTASVGAATRNPSAAACFADGPPARAPTVTSIPLSCRFIAWARPWLPYPSTVIFSP